MKMLSILFCLFSAHKTIVAKKFRETPSSFSVLCQRKLSANQKLRSLWKVGAAANWLVVDICCLRNKTTWLERAR